MITKHVSDTDFISKIYELLQFFYLQINSKNNNSNNKAPPKVLNSIRDLVKAS